jgi:hypothetical protein
MKIHIRIRIFPLQFTICLTLHKDPVLSDYLFYDLEIEVDKSIRILGVV